jgi:hypothetical protein
MIIEGSSNMPLEFVGLHSSLVPPLAHCLPLRGRVRRQENQNNLEGATITAASVYNFCIIHAAGDCMSVSNLFRFP